MSNSTPATDPIEAAALTATTAKPCLGQLLKLVKVSDSKSSRIKSLICDNCKVQQCDDTDAAAAAAPFNVDYLYEEYLVLIKKETELKLQIQQLNISTHNEEEEKEEDKEENDDSAANEEAKQNYLNMMEMLVRKDILNNHLSLLRTIISNGIPSTSSYDRRKLRDVAQVDVVEYDAKYRDLFDKRVHLELKIQKLNWR